MLFQLNPKNLSQSLRSKSILGLLLLVILLQQSIIHHSDHNIQLDSPCLICLSQNNLDTGVIIDELRLDILIPVAVTFIKEKITFNPQDVAWFRSRSPPVFH